MIDTSGYTPDAVAATARAVGRSVRTYAFVSSIDAYDLSFAPIDESSATKALPAGATMSERVDDLYGAHKAACERVLVDMLGAHRVIAVRAGLMIGPHDDTDRFTYWPVRVERGGEMLAPVGRQMPVQIIDARDVAAWIVAAIAGASFGAFNLTGGRQTFGDVLDACLQALTLRAGLLPEREAVLLQAWHAIGAA